MHTTLLNDRLIELSHTLQACFGSCVLAKSVHEEIARLRYFSTWAEHM